MQALMILATLLALAPLADRAKALPADIEIAGTEQQTEEATKKCYAVLFKLGPRYDAELPLEEMPGVAAHVKYVQQLHADGVVPLAGPCFANDDMTDLSGALYFIYARSEQEARAVAMQEPLVQEKVAEIASIWAFTAGVGGLQ